MEQCSFTHRQVQVIFIGVMTGSFLGALDQTIVATALPAIAGRFGNVGQLAAIASIYLLTSTAAMPIAGKLSDRYGRRQMYEVAILVFMVGSVLSGLAQSMTQLVFFRAVQGVGAGGLMVITQAIIADIVTPRERGRYQGYLSASWALASVAGPLLGGFFVDHASWRWVFFINVPICVAALVITHRSLRLMLPKRLNSPIDYAGAAFIVAGISSVLLILRWGGDLYDWMSGQLLTLAAFGFGCLVAFLWRERRAADPIVPLELFRIPAVRIVTGAAALYGMVMFGTILFIPLYFQVVRGDTATSSGLYLIPVMIGLLIGTTTSGRLVTRFGRYKFFPIFGMSCLATAYLILSRIGLHTPTVVVVVAAMLAGVGMGTTFQVMIVAMQNAVPQRTVGVATSLMSTLRSLGTAVGSAAYGAVLATRLDSELVQQLGAKAGTLDTKKLRGSPEQIARLAPKVRAGVVEAFAQSLHTVFLIAVPAALAGVALLLFLPELPLRTHAEPADVVASEL